MWFNSEVLNNTDESCFSENILYKDNIDNLKSLNVTKKNYKKLIELCDYLMVDNSNMLIDEILKIHNYDYNIIYQFEDFYKFNTKRLASFNSKKELETAIRLYCDDHIKCFHTYGFTSFWNVSKITDMSFMFENNKFNGDISKWDVSNVTNMDGMFHNSKFKKDISNWNVSNLTDMRFIII